MHMKILVFIQVLGSFLSKSSATADILHKLIIECIGMLHAAGFSIDAVTTDGAAWNRKTWKLFGIDENNLSCVHPCDESGKLWFLSDFLHLIKCLRNKLLEVSTFDVSIITPTIFISN